MMNKQTLLLVLVLVLLPLAGAQTPDFTFQLDSTTTMVLTGGWTQSDLNTSKISQYGPLVFGAMKTISTPTSTKWTVKRLANVGESLPCENTTLWDPQANGNIGSDPYGFAHEMALAMFEPCQMLLNDYANASISEGYADAKAFLILRKLAKDQPSVFQPMTGLALASVSARQRFLAVGGTLPRDVFGSDSCITGAVFELFAAKLGGTFVPLDQAFTTTPILQAVDNVVGRVSGQDASVMLLNVPKLFMLSQNSRAFLGYNQDGDPTDGTWLESYPTGIITGWNGSSTLTNPFSLYVSVIQRKAGVNSWGKANIRYRVLSPSGTELFTDTWANAQHGGIPFLAASGDPLPGHPAWPALTNSEYTVEVCLLNGTACDPQNTLTLPFLNDTTGWTSGKLVVITGDLTTKLQLAPNQPYTLTQNAGAVTVSGLPAGYAEVRLTDGNVTRTFPWVGDTPNANIWDWRPFDDPTLLGAVDPATFAFSGKLTPGSFLTLWPKGATQGNWTSAQFGVDGVLPVNGCSDQYGFTKITFVSGGQSRDGRIIYCSSDQINVLVPWEVPIGQDVSVQITRNGVTSNSRPMKAVATQPAIYMYDIPAKQGVVVHMNGSLVTSNNPPVAGEWLWLYGSGFGPVDDAVNTDHPSPTDRTYHCVNTTQIQIGGVAANIGTCSLVPGWAGVYQLSFQVPVSGSGKAGSAATTMVPLKLTVGGMDANVLTFPVL